MPISRRAAGATIAAVVVLIAAALAWGIGRQVAEEDDGPQTTPSSASAQPRPTSSARPTADERPLPPRRDCVDSAPCRIVIPSLRVDTSMDAKPTEQAWDPFLGRRVSSFGIPDDMTTTTWWSSGPAPGGRGMAVVLGHKYSAGYGVFNRLSDLTVGDVVAIDRGHRRIVFRVTHVVGPLSKTDPDALAGTLRRYDGTARLALISCIGAPDATRRHLDANVVVFADLTGDAVE